MTQLEPGPELDRAVAEAIGGTLDYANDDHTVLKFPCGHRVSMMAPPLEGHGWSPSTDWNDAMWAAERAGFLGSDINTWFQVIGYRGMFVAGMQDYYATGWKWQREPSEAPTGPHAICLAILAAKGQR